MTSIAATLRGTQLLHPPAEVVVLDAMPAQVSSSRRGTTIPATSATMTNLIQSRRPMPDPDVPTRPGSAQA
jgi:hypothetical protein